MNSSSQTRFRASDLRRWQSVVALLISWSLLLSPSQAAAPLAGSTIGNQATATYTDSSNATHTATSNVALTVVQQVASISLSSTQSKAGAPGGQVVFSHTLVNTGNGPDTFNLSLTQLTTDNFDLANAAIYADTNGDGLPDNSTAITSTGLLASGATFRFVVVGTVPATQTTNQNAQVSVNAASTFTPSTTSSNTDTVTVSSNAVIRVTQSLSASSGASPSGPYTFTLTYTNTGNVTATNLTLTDVLPAGFTYETGSGRWSGSGTTALTDAAAGDPAGINYDYGITQAGRMTAVIASVTPGQSGTLTFQAKVASGVAPGTLSNTAVYNYNDGAGAAGPFNSNTVLFTVTQPGAVTITGSTVTSAQQGATVNFPSVVTNTGYGTTTYELTLTGSTFPAGTTFRILRSDGATAVLDSNGNGTPDTGPVLAGATFNLVVAATLPPGAVGGPYEVKINATSSTDGSVTTFATDTLSVISTNAVDLTTNDINGNPAGAGPGPEGSAVVTFAGAPGDTVRFTLNIKNTSSGSDTYRLDSSSVSDFSTTGLPAGWTVVFKDANGAIISDTGVINAGATKTVSAYVTIPAGQMPTTQQVFFRALSPSTNASDIVHDAVTVGAVRRLTITPNNIGQIFPGGTAVYGHTVTNTGSVLEGDNIASTVALATGNNIAAWNAVIYYDANNNGVIDAGEVAVTDLSFVSNGAAGLAPGESVNILVKVFAPAGTQNGAVNTTTVTATTTNGSYVTTVPPVVTATESTTAVLSEIKIVKEQALDANADGVADSSFSTGNITIGAIPGACIRYRITITNSGAQTALNVVLSDVTPTFTTYHATVAAATTAGSVVSTPIANSAGAFKFNLGDIAPGASVVVTFGVKIDEGF